MPPIPCAHCGHNFMRITIDPEAPKLCNNCILKEEKRTIKKEDMMDNVDILISCPRQIQIEIEEHCINVGIDFTKYFLQLHKDNMQLKYDLSKVPGPDVYHQPKENISEKPDFVVPKDDGISFKKTLPLKKAGKK